ncbi:hypothetical protein AKJ47_02655 [candidate division MSBL1 archaeon SCGC-AAA261G05]|uniref:Uncharacterized protein n=2 Tax=candidate division MSBL1 TaxID=215777 RepID=A0A133V9T4_9EURY|nr:hypothetical protein AKJ47_02655 [candidate division MSBL1 archaeon SCGC-AAA261G05]KXB04085.1 hypothetical protein AKJ48_03385 [candidate division MSBL1 archaeon SCGC-AAA261O19]
MSGELDSISERLDEIEARLEKLEEARESSGTKAKELQNKATTKPAARVNHNYLKRTIEEAKKRFEKERGK